MVIDRNHAYLCKIKRINNFKANYDGELKIDSNNYGSVLIHDCPRKYLQYIKRNNHINITLECDGIAYTLVECELFNYYFKGTPVEGVEYILNYYQCVL